MAATKNKIRVGLIGCGGISNSHLPHLSTSDDVELAAFCDIVVERAKKHADKYGGEVYDDAAKMLKGTKLDAAYVLIPTYAHGIPERLLLDAGIPFLVEKPLGIEPKALIQLAKDIEAAGLIAAGGMMNRYRKSVNRAKELLQNDPAILMDGAWVGGPPLVKPGDYFADQPIGQWWPIKAKSGGQFVEQVIHTVDLVRYLGGDIAEVSAYAAGGFNKKLPNLIPNYDLDDAMVVSMKLVAGGIVNVMSCCSAQAGGGIFLNIWSSKHAFKFEEWAHHVKIQRIDEPGSEEIKGDIEEIFALEDRAFINAVKSGDPSGIKCSYVEGAKSTLVGLAANESLITGKPVKLQF